MRNLAWGYSAGRQGLGQVLTRVQENSGFPPIWQDKHPSICVADRSQEGNTLFPLAAICSLLAVSAAGIKIRCELEHPATRT